MISIVSVCFVESMTGLWKVSGYQFHIDIHIDIMDDLDITAIHGTHAIRNTIQIQICCVQVKVYCILNFWATFICAPCLRVHIGTSPNLKSCCQYFFCIHNVWFSLCWCTNGNICKSFSIFHSHGQTDICKSQSRLDLLPRHFVQAFMAVSRVSPINPPLTFPPGPPWGWHLWLRVKVQDGLLRALVQTFTVIVNFGDSQIFSSSVING